MTDTESALFAAVLADPADDGVRLVMADWLEERGDKRGRDRAAHIREDIAKGTEYTDWNLGAALVICGWESSCGLLGRGGAVVRRGFVAEVRCTLADWIEHGPDIVRTQPVETVRITDRQPYCANENQVGPWVWANFTVLDSEAIVGRDLSELPDEWIDLFFERAEHPADVHDMPGNRRYITASMDRDEAVEMLSDVAIAWARQQAV